ncbi:MAG TPA: hypothetical protein VFM93_01445, partial [Candidatus Limnocylindria bacterium]|nr:hypothetical protein [Candidatus Limnocylindria bacterium]
DRSVRILLLALALLTLAAPQAAADDGPAFRRTTPRAVLGERDGWTLLGVPGGRAWGIESALRRAPPRPATLEVELAVADPRVREAFVRVAWYARERGRQRQLDVVDSDLVVAGERRTVLVPLDPPEGARAYRVRVLARLVTAERSSDDAIAVGPSRVTSGRLALTRLLWDGPP